MGITLSPTLASYYYISYFTSMSIIFLRPCANCLLKKRGFYDILYPIIKYYDGGSSLMDSFNELWQVVSDYLRQTNSESIYNVWFSELEPISFDGSRAVLMTTAEFKRRILAQKFGGTLHSAFLNALGLDVDVEFIAPGEGYSQSDSSGSAAGSSEIDGSTRASNYFENTFDTFVVGASNKFAHAAAQAVAANPGKAYNPLFIYGNSGLGKTHLLNAICHEIKRNDPSMKIVLTDGEEFTNEFIEALNHRTTTEFQNKYRKVDVLLMDDVQFIASKERTQEEFFHTFNALHAAHKQIILSSDKPPKEMETLDERFRSRFEWGLIADIQPPDYETRMAILRKNAETYDRQIDEEIIKYIATNIKSNIRELEGAFNKIIAFAKLNKVDLTLSLAEEALKDVIYPNKPKEITPTLIINVVAEHFGVKPEDITSKKRNSEFVQPRQVVMYLCRELTDTSFTNIGKLLGKKDHTTIIHGVNKVSAEIQTNEELRNKIDIITKKINPS